VAQVFDVWYNKITMIELFAEWYIFETPIAIKNLGKLPLVFARYFALGELLRGFLRPGRINF